MSRAYLQITDVGAARPTQARPYQRPVSATSPTPEILPIDCVVVAVRVAFGDCFQVANRLSYPHPLLASVPGVTYCIYLLIMNV